MIIVDSCRAQHLIEIEEDIPANVCIIYSCRRGEYSVENGDNSAFFKSFMQGIQESQVIFHKNQEWCRLSELINHLKRKLDSIPKPNVQNADIYGSGADKILIPYNKSFFKKTKKKIYPKGYLKTCELTPLSIENYEDTIYNCIEKWVGYNIRGTERIVEINENKISVILPKSSYIHNEFLTHILSNCNSIFFSLILKWEKSIAQSMFRLMQRSFGLDFIVISPQQWLLTWKNGRYKGQALIHISKAKKMVIEISCRNEESNLLALDYLLPELNNIYIHLQKIDI